MFCAVKNAKKERIVTLYLQVYFIRRRKFTIYKIHYKKFVEN